MAKNKAERSYAWKDPTGAARLAGIALWILFAAHLLGAAVRLSLGGATYYTGDELEFTLAQTLTALADFLQVPGLLMGLFVVGWILRASINAHVLRPRMSMRPAWAVGWYFIPFANFVMPFQAMSEIWEASGAGSRKQDRLLNWWWGFWLLSGLFGGISSAVASPENAAAEAYATATFNLLGMATCLIFRRIVRKVTRAQLDRHAVNAFEEGAPTLNLASASA